MKIAPFLLAVAVICAASLSPLASADIVFNNVLIENVSGVNQTYSIINTFDTTFAAPNLIRGSIDTSVIGPNGTVSAPLGESVYTALIDGVEVWTLQDDPFSLGTGQDAITDFVDFGWQANNIPVNSSIGIELTFTLSPGATAAVISDFEVTPEPASLGLLAIGGLMLLRRRRRA